MDNGLYEQVKIVETGNGNAKDHHGSARELTDRPGAVRVRYMHQVVAAIVLIAAVAMVHHVQQQIEPQASS